MSQATTDANRPLCLRSFEDSEVYQYDPLDHNDASIRLIQVLPKPSEDGLIQCVIENFYISRPRDSTAQINPTIWKKGVPSYSCLSYTWGDGYKTHCIRIDGKVHFIHKNLWNFLDVTRKRIANDGCIRIPRRALNHGPRTQFDDEQIIKHPWIWIDAISIDQNNTVEKNHQVQQMGTIYKYANWVLMWLGGDCESAIQSHSTLPSRNETALNERQLLWLREHRYWTRAWITQEVVLAVRPAICTESGTYDLEEVFRQQEVSQTPNWNLEATGTAESAFDLLSLHVRGLTKLSAQELTIFQALDTFGATRHCSNILDRFYSLLALVPTCKIEVDYNISASKLLLQAISSFSGAICFCGISLAASALQVMPSEPLVESRAIVEIEVPRYCCVQSHNAASVINDKCYRCGTKSVLPVEFQQRDGSYICLFGLCENLRGHLFARENYPCDFSDIKCVSNDGRANGLLTLDCLRVHRIPGIENVPGGTGNKFPTRTWRFSLDALVQMAALQNEKHHGGVISLCSKMKFDINVGGPRDLFKMRRCL